MGVNQVILLGFLGKDPELRYTPTGKAVCNFSLATSEHWTGQDGQKQQSTEWHNIIAWGKTGEMANQYLKSGSEAHIMGQIKTRSWDDRDGNKRYRTEIIAKSIQFTGGSRKENSGPVPTNAPGAVPEDDLAF